MEKLKKYVIPAFICTLFVTLGVMLLLSMSNGKNEIFITLFCFGVGIIFTIFFCTFLIINKMK